MSEHEHTPTPTPWDFDTDYLATWINSPAIPQPIAKMASFSGFDQRANAAFIVKAVNSHDALVKALQLFVNRMVEYGKWDDGCFYYNRSSASELQDPIDMAKKALASIKGCEVEPRTAAGSLD